jgi:hypothetical protein
MKKSHSTRLTDGGPHTPASVAREVAVLPGIGEAITVRSAKAHLSGLLDLVASGREIVLHPLDSRILTRSRQVLEPCRPAVPLRTLDAIHMASCDLNQSFPLCSTDQRMRDAAKKTKHSLFPMSRDSRPRNQAPHVRTPGKKNH